mmetsp:Transcript_3840/g.7735  ORF Transcript_3840/g.7735 Transcript_3840/m.7735 type:complete len:108 (+) Transcript_3840:278-601(+)
MVHMSRCDCCGSVSEVVWCFVWVQFCAARLETLLDAKMLNSKLESEKTVIITSTVYLASFMFESCRTVTSNNRRREVVQKHRGGPGTANRFRRVVKLTFPRSYWEKN